MCIRDRLHILHIPRAYLASEVPKCMYRSGLGCPPLDSRECRCHHVDLRRPASGSSSFNYGPHWPNTFPAFNWLLLGEIGRYVRGSWALLLGTNCTAPNPSKPFGLGWVPKLVCHGPRFRLEDPKTVFGSSKSETQVKETLGHLTGFNNC